MNMVRTFVVVLIATNCVIATLQEDSSVSSSADMDNYSLFSMLPKAGEISLSSLEADKLEIPFGWGIYRNPQKHDLDSLGIGDYDQYDYSFDASFIPADEDFSYNLNDLSEDSFYKIIDYNDDGNELMTDTRETAELWPFDDASDAQLYDDGHMMPYLSSELRSEVDDQLPISDTIPESEANFQPKLDYSMGDYDYASIFGPTHLQEDYGDTNTGLSNWDELPKIFDYSDLAPASDELITDQFQPYKSNDQIIQPAMLNFDGGIMSFLNPDLPQNDIRKYSEVGNEYIDANNEIPNSKLQNLREGDDNLPSVIIYESVIIVQSDQSDDILEYKGKDDIAINPDASYASIMEAKSNSSKIMLRVIGPILMTLGLLITLTVIFISITKRKFNCSKLEIRGSEEPKYHPIQEV